MRVRMALVSTLPSSNANALMMCRCSGLVIEEEKSAMYAVRLNPVADSALLCQYRARYRALRVSFCCLRFVVDFASTTGLPWPTCLKPTAR